MTREEEIFQKANELYYTHAPFEATIEMAKWADKTMLDKICEWLDKNANKYIKIKDGAMVYDKKLVKHCRKAMEEQP